MSGYSSKRASTFSGSDFSHPPLPGIVQTFSDFVLQATVWVPGATSAWNRSGWPKLSLYRSPHLDRVQTRKQKAVHDETVATFDARGNEMFHPAARLYFSFCEWTCLWPSEGLFTKAPYEVLSGFNTQLRAGDWEQPNRTVHLN